jgi:cysteine-rich repeat protein
MNRITSLALLAALPAALTTACLDFGDGLPKMPVPEPDPGPLGDLVKARLQLPQEPSRLEYRIHNLEDTELAGDVSYETCEGVEVALADVCSEMYASEEVRSCWSQATFFYAHDVPRCAVRFQTWDEDAEMSEVFALDFAGAPVIGPTPGCGNGELDFGEVCDDGNHEMWDGCDPNCQQEEFNGCEVIIEQGFERAGVAFVDQQAWDGPRSHLMTNRGEAYTDVDELTCEQAQDAALAVCDDLAVQMPFVGWCWPETEHFVEDGQGACAVRLNVHFYELDPDTGVFTTGLDGLLAFTIR